MRRRAVTIVITLVTLLCSCDKGDTTMMILTDPNDPAPNTSPLVTVLYDPNALGDRSYNDLIYQGVEAPRSAHAVTVATDGSRG